MAQTQHTDTTHTHTHTHTHNRVATKLCVGRKELDVSFEREKSTGIELGIEPGTFRLLVGHCYH